VEEFGREASDADGYYSISLFALRLFDCTQFRFGDSAVDVDTGIAECFRQGVGAPRQREDFPGD
jgi:hypothetical protein